MEATLDAGRCSRRYGVLAMLNKVVLESGRKSLLVSRLRQSQKLGDAGKEAINEPLEEDQRV